MEATIQALSEYTSLMSEMLDTESFLRSSGEAMARYDARWKRSATAHSPEVTQDVADFLLIASTHVLALKQSGAMASEVPTLLSLVVSVDMSGADVSAIADAVADLHILYLQALSARLRAEEHDEFVCGHLRAMLRTEASVYLRLPLPSGLRYEAVAAASRRYIDNNPLNAGEPDFSTATVKEGLVDMFSRMMAIGQ